MDDWRPLAVLIAAAAAGGALIGAFRVVLQQRYGALLAWLTFTVGGALVAALTGRLGDGRNLAIGACALLTPAPTLIALCMLALGGTPLLALSRLFPSPGEDAS